jgi:hypothetical protein
VQALPKRGEQTVTGKLISFQRAAPGNWYKAPTCITASYSSPSSNSGIFTQLRVGRAAKLRALLYQLSAQRDFGERNRIGGGRGVSPAAAGQSLDVTITWATTTPHGEGLSDLANV